MIFLILTLFLYFIILPHGDYMEKMCFFKYLEVSITRFIFRQIMIRVIEVGR